MDRRNLKPFLLALCLTLALAACKSGPPASGGDEAAAFERKLAYFEDLLAKRALAAGALDALVANRPERVWLTEVRYDDPGGLRIKGIAPTNIALAAYISRLSESPALEGVSLAGSVVRTQAGYQWAEFSLLATARVVAAEGSAPSRAAASKPAERLAALEGAVPPRPASAGMLRDFQRLATDAGLQMTKYEPGADSPGEFTGGLALSLEVAGDWEGLSEYLRALAALPALWTVETIAAKSASPDDPRAPVRASVAAKAHFPL
jgi:Tfp pilus assembly protein PilN